MSIIEKDLPSILTASISKKGQATSQIGSFISASAISLFVYMKEIGIEIIGRGFTIYHNKTEDFVDIDCCLPVAKIGQDRGEIKFKEIKSAKCASLIQTGSYDKLHEAHQQLQLWCQQNGKKIEEIREVFLKGPQETKNSNEYQTEIQYIYSS